MSALHGHGDVIGAQAGALEYILHTIMDGIVHIGQAGTILIGTEDGTHGTGQAGTTHTGMDIIITIIIIADGTEDGTRIGDITDTDRDTDQGTGLTRDATIGMVQEWLPNRTGTKADARQLLQEKDARWELQATGRESSPTEAAAATTDWSAQKER